MNTNEPIYSMPKMIGKDAHVLILGSMPGAQSLAKQQYYANSRNQFWRIMYALFNEEYSNPSYAEKTEFVKKHQIALWDSIHYCKRRGSLDSAIKDEEPNDIPSLLREHPDIRVIAFNGSKSFAVFKKHFKSGIPSRIDLIKMPSTSPTPSRYPKTMDEKIEDWSKIKNYL
ncbi:DNA-deoxyinosine glycosylase [Sporolactobacillus shoreicorticis]|uniref:DNA-deoxyinosine glycosylase n=1 Tax=Sporolactobacillus shoreicorticis TaxID=1923877 RepID=A0ABW5S4R1_9BACL|nr:DNA-deoxyinosine glycosylase [Sporolactobacillus shoreicorticis]MCO7127155.1 DNA-deoxyinosine glycosylase [Sporolactobacillus shoreicorticis]